MKRLAGLMVLASGLALAGFGANVVRAQSSEDEIRQEDGHVHGIVELNMAVEDSRFYVELASPAVNIVGFEHAPNTAEQEAAIDDAIEVLGAGESLFILPTDASCSLASAEVESDIEAGHDGEHEHDHEHGDEHSDHADEHDDEHEAHAEHEGEHAEHDDEHEAHAEHEGEHEHEDEHEHADEHSEHEEHGEHSEHEGEHAGEVHSEFAASYEFECGNPDALSQVEVGLFDAFPGIEAIEVQALTDSGQVGADLTPTNATLTW